MLHMVTPGDTWCCPCGHPQAARLIVEPFGDGFPITDSWYCSGCGVNVIDAMRGLTEPRRVVVEG